MLIRRDEHSIDKTFRKKLHDAGGDVPLHLWEGIRKKTGKRRPVFAWWWVAAALVVGFFSGWIFLRSGSENEGLADRGTTSSAQPPVAQNNDVLPLEHLSPDRNTATAFPSDDQKEGSSGIEKPLTVTTKRAPHKVEDQKRSRDRKQRQDKGNNSIAISPDKGRGLDLNHSDSRLLPIASTSSVITASSNDAIPVEEHIEENENTPAHPLLAQPKLGQAEEELLAEESLPYFSAEETIPAILPLANKRFFAGTYVAFSQPKRVSASGSSEALNALTQRSSLDVNQQFGICAGFYPLKNVSLSIGLETSSFREAHLWQDTTGNISSYENVTFDVAFIDGDSTQPVINMNIETVVADNRQFINRQHYNQYTSLNLPLLAGFGHRWGAYTLALQCGPVFRIQRGYMGSLVFAKANTGDGTSSLSPTEYAAGTLDEYVYLNNYYSRWRTDLHIGVTNTFQVFKGLGVSVGAQYRRMMNTAGQRKEISHRIVQPGFSVGVNYTF